MTVSNPHIKSLVEQWERILRDKTGDPTLSIIIHQLPQKTIKLDELIKIVCNTTGYSLYILKKPCKERPIVQTRHLICYYAFHMKLGTLKTIASKIGVEDHSSVIHGRDTLKKLLDARDISISAFVKNIDEKIREYSGSAGA